MPVVTMPDGVNVSFPDDMPPEQIKSLIRQKFPNETAAVEPPAGDFTLENKFEMEPPADEGLSYSQLGGANPLGAGVGTMFDLFGPSAVTRGAAEGVMDLSGLMPIIGPANQRIAEPALDYVFGPDEEMTPRESLGRNVTRFGVGAAAPSVGLATATPRLLASGPARTVIGRAVQKLVKPYATNPGRAMQGDIAGGVGSGTAVSGLDEYAPEEVASNPIVRAITAILGGIGGMTAFTGLRGGANMAVKGARKATGLDLETNLPANAETGELFNSADADAAAIYAQQFASNPEQAAANIRAETEALRPMGPEALPTTGLMSNDVGLIAFENAARQDRPVPFIEARRRTNQQAADLVDDTAPAGATGRQFTNAGEAMQRDRVAQAQTAQAYTQAGADINEAARRQAGAQVQAYQGAGAPAAANIDDAVVNQTLVPMQERMSELYQGVDPNRIAGVDVSSLIDDAEAVRAGLGDLNDPAKVLPRGLLGRIGRRAETNAEEVAPATGLAAQDEATTIGDIVAVMPEISSTITRAQKAQNFRLADNLRMLRDSMKAIVADAAENGDEAAQRFMEADAEFSQTMGPTFKRGPGDEAQKFRKDFNLDRQNRSTTPPSATAGRFLKPGQPEKAQALGRILEQSPDPAAGQQAVREYLMADLANSGVVDPQTGALRPDTLRRWGRSWGDALDVVPGLRAEIDTMTQQAQQGADMTGRLADELASANAALTDVERNTGALRFMLGNDPPAAIGAILNSGDPERAMQDVIQTIGTNQSAKDGLKAALREYLLEKATTSGVEQTTSGRRPVSFAKLDKLFGEHEKVLAQVYSPEEMQALRGAHRFLAGWKGRELSAATGSQTAERMANKSEDFWRFAEIGLKAKFGILKGGGIMRTLRLWAQTLPSNDAAVKQLVHQMWFDPELAQHLLTRNVDVGGAAWNAKLNRLLAVGESGRGAPAAAQAVAEKDEEKKQAAK